MASRSQLWVVLCVAVSAFLAGCKGSGEQDTRPLPAPEPRPTSSGFSARDEPPPKRAAGDEGPAPSKPKPPVPERTEEPTGAAPGGDAPTATPTPAASPSPASGGAGGLQVPPAPSVLTQPSAPSAACITRCQGALQGCLSAPVDGGVPGFANLEVCKKAFEACQSACAKQ